MSNAKPEELLSAIVGRELSSEEIGDLYRIRETLGLQDNDAIWSILAALGAYKVLYEDLLTKLKSEVKEGLTEFDGKLSVLTHAAERDVIQRVDKSYADALNKLLDRTRQGAETLNTATYKRRMTMFSALAVSVACVCITLFGVGVYIMAQRADAGELAWVHSAEGRAARTFAELNNVQRMLDCEEPQSTVERGKNKFCLPYDSKTKEVKMWRIK